MTQVIGCIDAALHHYGKTPLVLSVSGGGDSMAMALAFSRWRDEQISPPRLRAVIVNHGLRGEAADEAAAVKARLAAIGIRAVIRTIEAPAPRSGIQETLRRGRYALLANEAAPDDAIVITAHHADDQAETVAMRSAHGSGLQGLGGMRELSVMGGVRVLRPFLGLRCKLLRAVLDGDGSGVEVVDDPSNRDRRFERVRVRQGLSHGYAGNMTAPLLALAAAAARIGDGLGHAVGVAMRDKTAIAPEGWGWIDHAAYAAMPGAARGYLLARLHRGLMPSSNPVRRAAIMRLDEALLRCSRKTLGGCEWRHDKAGGRIIAFPEAERLPPAMPLEGSEGNVLFDGRWRVFLPAGNPPGARLEALGRNRAAVMRRGGHFAGIPARALWRMPFIHNASPDLENGGFIPHLIKAGAGDRIRNLPTMVFTGARVFDL